MTKLRQRERARRRAALSGPFNPKPGAWFHGSQTGLAPGTILLPPRERGDRRTELQLQAAGLDDLAEIAGQFVFVSSCAFIALAFVGRRPRPGLYEVSVEGDVEPDEDDRGRSWKYRRAKIVRQVPVSAKVLRELTRRTAVDGYDVRDNFIWLMAMLEEEDAAA